MTDKLTSMEDRELKSRTSGHPSSSESLSYCRSSSEASGMKKPERVLVIRVAFDFHARS